MMNQAASNARYASRGLHAEREAWLIGSSSPRHDRQAGAAWPFASNIPSDAWISAVDTGGVDSGWFPRALTRLKQIDEEAAEECYPPVNDETKRRAKRLLFAASGCPIEPAVYPSMDGEIAIYFKSPVAAAALLILVNNEGGAGCYSSMHGESRRRRYDDSSMLPDDFLKERLRALGESTLSQASAATAAAFPFDREREAARHLQMHKERRRERHEDSRRPPNQFADARLQALGGPSLSLRP